MGAKVVQMLASDGVTHYAWLWHCPGCDDVHQCDKRWSFNGDEEKPTFGPAEGPPNCSVLVTVEYGDGRPTSRCHSHVTDGRVAFGDDCTHALKGQTVEIPDWAERGQAVRALS